MGNLDVLYNGFHKIPFKLHHCKSIGRYEFSINIVITVVNFDSYPRYLSCCKHRINNVYYSETPRLGLTVGRTPYQRKRGNLPIRENLVIMWTYDRPTDRSSAPQAYQCLLSHFLAGLVAQEKTNCTSMLWSIDICQNREPVLSDRTASSGVDPSRSSVFWSYPQTSY